MAFLDNSGDIILDAVLTDTGRFRMARGDFKISKFALGDDEIDYSLFNRNHPSGSAYYDLEILKTPVLEAFTNNTSLLKSRLMSINNTNLLHLPILKLSNGGYENSARLARDTKMSNIGTYVITVDSNTEGTAGSGAGLADEDVTGKGILLGAAADGGPTYVLLETGLDTTKISPALAVPSNLRETQFIIEMDDRLGHLVTPNGTTQVPASFVDDDQIASYYISANSGVDAGGLIRNKFDSWRGSESANEDGSGTTSHRIRGPRGRMLQFKVKPSINLTTSKYLFEKLGGTFTQTSDTAPVSGFKSGKSFYYIDTFVRVTAATTGYSIDVPIRFVKKTTVE
jgi:hypothetical protein